MLQTCLFADKDPHAVHNAELCCNHVHVAGMFDLLTKAYMRSTKQEKAGVPAAMASGITASCLAQVISFPLETVSRRLQVSGCGNKHLCMVSCKFLYGLHEQAEG